MSTAYKADKSGYIWKTFMMNVLPKVMKHFMLVNGAVFGIQAINKLFEDDEKKKKKAKGYLKELSQAYVRIPSYDQEHYQCIPLGLTSTGKAAYLRIPMDYEGQIFGTIGYLTAKEIMNQIDNNGDLPETYKKLAKTVSEQTPYNWHPIITTARDLITYTMGDSPTDWKGYDVIPKNITNTGGETYLKESAPYIWRHLLSNFGVRNFVDLGHGDLEVDKEWYESILKQPGLSALGSYLKFSDRGLQEKIQRKWDKAKEQKAEISLDRYKGVINLANGEVVTLKQAVAMAMNPGTTKKQFLKAINIKRGSVYAKMLSRAKSKEEKTIVLMTILEQEK